MKRLLLICLIVFSLTDCQSKKPYHMDFSTVKELNLDRYMGRWYEIARYNHSFEKGLVGVTATYSLQPDGKITVINQGYKNSLDGKRNIAKG